MSWAAPLLLISSCTMADHNCSHTVKPALVTTCIQRPLGPNYGFTILLRDHLYSKITFWGPKCGRLIQVPLYVWRLLCMYGGRHLDKRYSVVSLYVIYTAYP